MATKRKPINTSFEQGTIIEDFAFNLSLERGGTEISNVGYVMEAVQFFEANRPKPVKEPES